MLGAGGLSIACVVFCVLLQYQGISWLWRLNSRGGPRARARIAVSALYLIGLHLLEVAIFGVGYLIGERLFGIGAIAASRPIGMSDVFYYSAEVFSTLGLGDVYATSDLRMLTSVEALSGMLLLSWSASFLVLAVQGARGADQNPEL
jgi:Ion channel